MSQLACDQDPITHTPRVNAAKMRIDAFVILYTDQYHNTPAVQFRGFISEKDLIDYLDQKHLAFRDQLDDAESLDGAEIVINQQSNVKWYIRRVQIPITLGAS